MWNLFLLLIKPRVYEIERQLPIKVEFPVLGIKQIDDEHQRIMDIMNSFNSDMSDRVYFRIMKKVIDYTEEHCRTEEAFMKSIDYSGLKMHQIEHRSILNFMKTFLKPIIEDRRSTAKELAINECRAVLRFHIKYHDGPLVDFYKNNLMLVK